MRYKKCEHCGEEIHIRSKKCPFCNQAVAEVSPEEIKEEYIILVLPREKLPLEGIIASGV